MGKKIYIVDDEGDLAEILTMHLQDYGYEVLCQRDSRIAVDEMAMIKPDLLITDLQMPFVSGRQVIQKLHETKPLTPVIVISGFAQELETQALPEGGVGFLQKPFDLSEMVGLVVSFLGD